MAQLMPLPLTVSCSSKIQMCFTFLVPAYPDCPGKEADKWLLVVVVLATGFFIRPISHFYPHDAMLAVAQCPSVCPPQVGVLLKRKNESGWFLAWELPSTNPSLLQGNSCISLIRALPSGTLSQSPDLENFVTIG